MMPRSHITERLQPIASPAKRLFRMGDTMPRLHSTGSSAAIGLLLIFGLLLPLAGRAEDAQGSSPDVNSRMPLCGPQAEGQVYCKFGTIYECRPVSPNSLERGTGWHWKMDILRSCAEPLPATIDQQGGSLPDIIYAPETNSSGVQSGSGSQADQRGQTGQAGLQGQTEQWRRSRHDGQRGRTDQWGGQGAQWGRSRPSGQNKGTSSTSPRAGSLPQGVMMPTRRDGFSMPSHDGSRN
jgi:hypothetical protein